MSSKADAYFDTKNIDLKPLCFIYFWTTITDFNFKSDGLIRMIWCVTRFTNTDIIRVRYSCSSLMLLSHLNVAFAESNVILESLVWKLRQLSSLLSSVLMQRLVASHHCHPPFAPCSPQLGCFYGNSRIRSKPASAVYVSLPSFLSSSASGFFNFEELLWFILALRYCSLPGYKMEDERVLLIKGRVVFVKMTK